ncbi:MAG: tyrosine-type recombinase/integrase [Alphaproteobacteria bacterium]|nr:tyrosine-type recombinase/integrase [Alphaproteobacteria bacterium]
MSAKLISLASVKALKAPTTGNRVTWDAGRGSVTGFGVRITAKGAVSFVLRYVIDGRERRVTLGKFPDLTVAVAREMAAEARANVAKGNDPLDARRAARQRPTVDILADEYLERHGPNKGARSVEDDRAMLRDHVRPRLGKIFVDSLTSRDIEILHRAMKDTPYRANRVLALIRAMLNLAKKWKWDADPSVTGTVTPYPEEARQFWLTASQLSRLAEVLGQHKSQQSANIIRLLIMTGARRSEVMRAEWSEFDLERGIWTKPSHHTKQKKTERTPLSAPARQLLSAMKRGSNSQWLFPGRTGKGPRTEIKGFWESVRKSADLEGVRVHDLRHTFASHLVSSGYSLELIGRLVGHTQAATTRRYAHVADDPLRQAAEGFGEMFVAASRGESAEVVPFKGGRK